MKLLQSELHPEMCRLMLFLSLSSLEIEIATTIDRLG